MHTLKENVRAIYIFAFEFNCALTVPNGKSYCTNNARFYDYFYIVLHVSTFRRIFCIALFSKQTKCKTSIWKCAMCSSININIVIIFSPNGHKFPIWIVMFSFPLRAVEELIIFFWCFKVSQVIWLSLENCIFNLKYMFSSYIFDTKSNTLILRFWYI